MILYLPFIAVALTVINLWTFTRFWQDKQAAIHGWRRVPENDLLFCAMIGGSIGALIARSWLRHKTRKEPFSTQLLLIAFLQLGALIGFGLF